MSAAVQNGRHGIEQRIDGYAHEHEPIKCENHGLEVPEAHRETGVKAEWRGL
ncbi:hypothetical protein D3C73_1641690 [compost metagenome]